MGLGLVAALGAFAGCTAGSRSNEGSRVLIFGIDGATWDVIDQLFAGGELPNLKQLYDRGLHGTLQSRPPALSPVVWTTIFTGRPHAEHGVSDWKTSHSTHRKVRAIWEIASSSGLRTHVLNVPSTWPPEPINGTMLSGFPLSGSTIGGNTGEVVLRSRFGQQRMGACYQGNVERIREEMDRLKAGGWSEYFPVVITGRPQWKAIMKIKRLGEESYYLSPCYRVDPGLAISYPTDARAKIESEIGEAYIPEGPGWSKHAEPDTPGYLFQHLLDVSRTHSRVAERLVAAGEWDLFVYVDTLVDRVSHPYWSYMRPDDYPNIDRAKADLYKDAVREAYRETDRQLGRVLAGVEDNVYVVIVSDHGFQSSRDPRNRIGTHSFDGVYLIAGPGMQGAEGARGYIEDVGPTALYLLGLSIADDMSGKVLPEVLERVGRPLERVATYETGTRSGSVEPVDAKTWEQLRGLGYVDGAAPARRRPSGK